MTIANQSPNQISLSVVLPAHNEEENIKSTVDSCLLYLQGKVSDFEIIVVHDGSTDSTLEILKKLNGSDRRVIYVNHEINRGYGDALKSGFDRARLDYIFFMDSDGQFDIADLGRLLQYIEKDNVVIGYREDRADSAVRSLNAWLYAQYIRLFFGLSVRDMDCAFKIFPNEAYEKVRPVKSGGALFSAEFLIKLKNAGYALIEVPVRHFPRKFGTQSGANIRVILRMFRESWKLRNELRD
mgnify:FL=1